jgi:parallel beta-helix repeat protein
LKTRQISFHIGWASAVVLLASFSAPSALAQTDIRSFGARCDGSDDSGAVQAALNSVSNGGTVVVSCSAGIGGSGIVLANKSNVTVTASASGAGFRALAQTSLGAGGFSPVLFKVSNCSGCVIKDLTIDNRNIGVAGIGFEVCTNSKIQNVSVFNTGLPTQAGIVASGGTGNSYIGNTIRFAQKVGADGVRGMWIGNGGSQTELNATIANNTISDVGATGIATHVNNAIIRDNMVTNAAGAGIKVSPTSGLGGQTTVSGNTIRGSLFHGIQISKADSPVIISGNTIDANTIAGIYASDGAFQGRITGNTITNNPEAAIYLYNGDNLMIDNNQIVGNRHGILIETPPGYNIRGLQITGNNITGQQQNGVTVWGRGGSLDSMSINSNSIYNGSSYGVQIDWASGSLNNISATGNCFANNSYGTITDNTYHLSPVASSASCSNPAAPTSPTADKTVPSVAITSPANGASVSGTIAIAAAASDNVGVAGVQFLLNGAAFGPKLTAAPFSVQWDTRTVSNGSYQWNAVATDAAGNSATSATVFAQVANTDVTAPTVRILTPAGGVVSGTVGITASASDNIGVAGVQYTLNGAALGAELKTAPYAYSWNTAALAPGNYTIGATARDAAGNRANASISVSIADKTAPAVRITAPTGGTVSGVITLTAAASDNVGVAGVQFLVDGAAYGSESTSGYSVSLNTANLSNAAHTISAIARDAAGNKTVATGVTVTVSNIVAQQPVTTTTTTVVKRINAGGGAYTDPTGAFWAADSNYNGGYTYAPGKAVSGTTVPAIYQSQRWYDKALAYDFAVANGSYTVNLKFAELYFGGAGQRVFSIAINGQVVANNFDIVAAAGGSAKAVDRSFPVNVTGGKITIQMNASVDDPAVNAIEIFKVTTVTTQPAPTPTPVPPAVQKVALRVNAGGPLYKDAAGNTWSADTGASAGYQWGTNATVANTNDQALYRNLRWNNNTLAYQFAVPNGTYTVNLKFAELYFWYANQRIFDITINGQKVLSNFDIVQQAGGPNRAVDKAFTVNVTGGAIAIQLTSTVDDPQVNAIEIFN